jgi:hypothetical protein
LFIEENARRLLQAFDELTTNDGRVHPASGAEHFTRETKPRLYAGTATAASTPRM